MLSTGANFAKRNSCLVARIVPYYTAVPYYINIYICHLFFGIADLDIASYADDNTPYTFSSELDVALKKLRSYTIKIFEWIHNNRLKLNAEKCNLITRSTSCVEIQIENIIISSVKRVKLLGVHINGRLDFDYHVNQICKKASKKNIRFI